MFNPHVKTKYHWSNITYFASLNSWMREEKKRKREHKNCVWYVSAIMLKSKVGQTQIVTSGREVSMVSSIYNCFFLVQFSLRDQHWFTSNNRSSITCVGEYPKGIIHHNFFLSDVFFSSLLLNEGKSSG